MFYIGQEVVCVDDSSNISPLWHGGAARYNGLHKGHIYRIVGMLDGYLALAGIYNGPRPGWRATRFRPVAKATTSTGFQILEDICKRETIDLPTKVL